MPAIAAHSQSAAVPLEPAPRDPFAPGISLEPGAGDPLVPAVSLEQALGDPLDEHRPGSFRASVEADRDNRFPRQLTDAALDWGIAEHLIPEECGGRLRSLEECCALSRVLSRRDLTATIALGANLLASLPVWLKGSDEQKRAVAGLLRRRRFLSFALSERDHGADITAGEVTARESAGGWRIDGTKWLINNAGRASAATVTARTGDGFRGLTLFHVARAAADGDQWSTLPKIYTHGLRGAALSGIDFSGFPARDADVVGRTGEGLEILLKTLQITRVLVGSFALGGLDTCLRAGLAFARSRRLYGAEIAQLEPVARRLVDAYADLLIGETVTLGACRAAHLSPDQLPLMSACVKYLVPQMATDSIESLGVVLGARSYLAEEHWHGIFDKMRRDCAVTTLFDGSAPVNLGAIVDQLSTLGATRAAGDVEDVPVELFSRSAPPLPWLDEERFDLATDSDTVHRGIAVALEVIRGEAHRIPHHRPLIELLEWCEAQTARLDAQVEAHAADAEWRRSGAAYDLAARYSRLHSAGACAWKWLAWRADTSDAFMASGAWLVLCLRGLTGKFGRDQAAFDEIDGAALARLQRTYDDGQLFSDLEPPLPWRRPDSSEGIAPAANDSLPESTAERIAESFPERIPEHIEVSFRDGSSTQLRVLPTTAPDAPVVLCLPAMGVRSNYYEVLGDTLAEQGFHAVLADLRGCGESSVRASRRVSFGYAEVVEMELPAIVESVCEQLGTEQVILLGHSLGGQLGLLYAATSTRVSHVILVASGSAWYRKVPGIRSLGRFLGLQFLFATTLVCGHLPKWLPFAGREARRLMLDWGYESMTGRYRVSRSAVDYEQALAESTVPALFLTFPGDAYVPAPCSAHLAGKLATAVVARQEIPPEKLRLAKTDHFRWVKRPQAVAETVSEWIEPHAPEAGLRAVG